MKNQNKLVGRQNHLFSRNHPSGNRYSFNLSSAYGTHTLSKAGPLALAREHLKGDEPFFVLNSDVICHFPFEDLLRFHKSHGKEGTIMVTKVEEPSKYGVVVHKEDGQIIRFVEKPKEFVGNKINSGIYLFSPAILDRIEVHFSD